MSFSVRFSLFFVDFKRLKFVCWSLFLIAMSIHLVTEIHLDIESRVQSINNACRKVHDLSRSIIKLCIEFAHYLPFDIFFSTGFGFGDVGRILNARI